MASSSSSRPDIERAPNTDTISTKRAAAVSPFRELRQHLAAIHRILNHDYPGRGEVHGSIAVRLNESLCALARSARTIGLSTYCSLALHVLEQLSSSIRTRYVPREVQDLLLQWVRLSWLYLLAPTNPVHARELVTHMGNRRWERSVCRVQQDMLLESLQTESLLLATLLEGTRSPSRRR